jgi:hypothetical protein
MRPLLRFSISLAIVAAIVTIAGPAGPPAGAQQPTPASVQPTPTVPLPPTATPPPTSTPLPGVVQTPRPAQTPGQPGVPSGQPAAPGQPAAQTGPVSARIVYPPSGQIIALQPMLVLLEISGIRLDAHVIGAPSMPGVGHWLLLVDGVEVAAGDAREVYMSGLPPGGHELALQVRNNDRSPLVPPVGTTLTICVEVCSAEPVPPDLPEVPAGLPRTGTGGLLAGHP